MNRRQQYRFMKNKVHAVVFGLAFAFASAGSSSAMSHLISLSSEPMWPTSSTPGGYLVYHVTTVGRGGAGLLEVTLNAGDLPPGVTATFSPSTLRFTGNQLTAQVSTMTVFCPGCPLSLDCFPYTLTGTALRENLTITNTVTLTAEYVAARPATLYIDNLGQGNLAIHGLGATGKTYQIEFCTDLSNPVWMPLGSAIADGNGRFTLFTQTAGDSARFYRALTSSDAFVCQ